MTVVLTAKTYGKEVLNVCANLSKWSTCLPGNIPPTGDITGWTNVTYALNATGSGTRIDVGGGNNDHVTLDTLDPTVLTAGSVVNIFYNVTAYNTKYVFHKSGTETNPIVINGVTDPTGKRPKIDFNGATTQNVEDSNLTWVAPYGGWTLTYSRKTGSFSDVVEWMEFRNLEMYGANAGNTSDGATSFVSGAAPIRFNEADHIKLIGNIFHDNGNGIFVHSARANSDYQIVGNKFMSNGVVGSFKEHNLYFQAVSDRVFSNVVEGNFFGPLITGALGMASMKHRGTDLIFRYNVIICEERALDLVELQDGLADFVYLNFTAQEILDRYRTSYIYGNQFWLDDARDYTAAYLIHVGMDTGTAHPTDDQLFSSSGGAAEGNVMARGYQSPVYFYNNSIFANSTTGFYKAFFDGDAVSAGVSRHTVEFVAANNIWHFADSTSPFNTNVSHLRHTGQVTYQAANHVYLEETANSTLNESRDGGATDTDVTIIGGTGSTLTQATTGLDPLFTDVTNADLEQLSLKLQVGSAAIGQGVTLPAPMSNYPVEGQPVLASEGGGVAQRITTNNLGAYE